MNYFVKKIGFFTAFIVPFLVVSGFYLGGWYNYVTLLFAFVMLPAIDRLSGVDIKNTPAAELDKVSHDFYYRFITYLWTYLQVAFIFWCAYAAVSGRLENAFEWIGFILGCALVTGGIGITVAHELGHKKTKVQKLYSKLLLLTVCYMHFYIEHNRGHHVHVATPADPATAKINENFYAFWFRSVFGGYAHAWSIEKERLARNGYKSFSIRNEMIWYAVLPIVFCSLLTLLFSMIGKRFAWEVPLFFFSQSFFAFTLLELVNYVEHYGIERRELSPGKFERVNPIHSWNASHLISNFFLFQLQRHSDHHAFANKPYQVLNHHDQSPQLPFGYPTMIIIALLPSLWFDMMNTRLQQWRSSALA